jgi:hypothetical protein
VAPGGKHPPFSQIEAASSFGLAQLLFHFRADRGGPRGAGGTGAKLSERKNRSNPAQPTHDWLVFQRLSGEQLGVLPILLPVPKCRESNLLLPNVSLLNLAQTSEKGS